jgi:formate dehydrogenase maturation protein FdhE
MQIIRKIGIDIKSFSGCAVCKSVLRSVESIRRSDSNILQLLTCNECNHKWKELWVRCLFEVDPKP